MATISYQKLNQTSQVNVNAVLEPLVITQLEGNGGYSISLTVPTILVPNCTVTKNVGTGHTTISSSTTNAFKYIPIGSVITLSVAGSAVLPSNTVVLSKTANSIICNKESGVTSGTSGASTISCAPGAKTAALVKVKLELLGTGTSSYKVKATLMSYDGSVVFSAADSSNAVDTQSLDMSVNMTNFLTNLGVVPSDSNSVDLTT